MDLGLKGKRALVLGSSSGLGFAVAKGLAEEGAKVAICSRSKERSEKAASQVPDSIPLVADIKGRGEGARLVRETVSAFGGIDILVTNTGGPPTGPFIELTDENWQEGFDSLYLGAIECMREALPHMEKQQWGRILLITSMAAKEPLPKLTVSNALRAGLLGLMKTLSSEVGPHNITVNSLLPGFTATEHTMKLFDNHEENTQTIPLRRYAEPSEFADLALFLASQRAAYITGQAIACDGGWLRGI